MKKEHCRKQTESIGEKLMRKILSYIIVIIVGYAVTPIGVSAAEHTVQVEA